MGLESDIRNNFCRRFSDNIVVRSSSNVTSQRTDTLNSDYFQKYFI
jgi:hypothetical protein